MSINTYLDNISSNLIIKDEPKDSIETSLSVFCVRMKDYFDKYSPVALLDIKIFGSYERDTNLPQSADAYTDVDIMLVLENDGCTPQTYLDRVRKAVESKYSTSDIAQSSPTIVLKMQHIRFEVTPAIKCGGHYFIRNSYNNWMITCCEQDLYNVSHANSANYFKIKPLIRLIKYWNVSLNNKSFNSYQIEQKLVDYYSYCRNQGYDTKRYLLTGFLKIYSLVENDGQQKLLDKAITYISKAIEQEYINPGYALDLIRCIIPEI